MSTEHPREIAWDCRFFLGDRPCIWHKQTGALCTCERYERMAERGPRSLPNPNNRNNRSCCSGSNERQDQITCEADSTNADESNYIS